MQKSPTLLPRILLQDSDRYRKRIFNTFSHVPPASRYVQPISRNEPCRIEWRGFLAKSFKIHLIREYILCDRILAKIVILYSLCLRDKNILPIVVPAKAIRSTGSDKELDMGFAA